MSTNILGFSSNFYTERRREQLKGKGWKDEDLDLAEERLAEHGLWIGMAAGVAKPKAIAATEVADPLPDNFPYKKELEAGGVFSMTQLAAMPDDAVLEIKNIGPQRLEEIRAAQPTPLEPQS